MVIGTNVTLIVLGKFGTGFEVRCRDKTGDEEQPSPIHTGKIGTSSGDTVALPVGYFVVLAGGSGTQIADYRTASEPITTTLK
jgi:hypothetical protein